MEMALASRLPRALVVEVMLIAVEAMPEAAVVAMVHLLAVAVVEVLVEAPEQNLKALPLLEGALYLLAAMEQMVVAVAAAESLQHLSLIVLTDKREAVAMLPAVAAALVLALLIYLIP